MRCVTLTALLIVPAAIQAQVPVPEPGSPGRAVDTVQVPDACPTFSWSRIDGASGYELAVYSIDPAQADVLLDAKLREHIAAGITTWTPSLSECFAAGGTYAWFVRAETSTGWSEWSEARRFGVPSAPTLAEVERALAVLRAARRASARAERGAPRAAPDTAQSETSASATPRGTGADSVAIRGLVADASGLNVGVLGAVASADADSAGVVGFW